MSIQWESSFKIPPRAAYWAASDVLILGQLDCGSDHCVTKNPPLGGVHRAGGRAKFIRVNVHYGVMAAEEGLIEGEAFQTMRHRRALGADVKVLADVLVKHAVPLGPVDLGLMARETAQRGLADGLIVSGVATGQGTASFDVSVVRRATPDGLVLVGSGVDENNIWRVIEHSGGAIIGASLKEGGIITNRVDPKRVRRRSEIFRSLP